MNGVLGNDSDVALDQLTAVLVSGPSGGTLTLHADGSFVFVPQPGFTGTTTFAYTATDGRWESAPETVSIKIFAGIIDPVDPPIDPIDSDPPTLPANPEPLPLVEPSDVVTTTPAAKESDPGAVPVRASRLRQMPSNDRESALFLNDAEEDDVDQEFDQLRVATRISHTSTSCRSRISEVSIDDYHATVGLHDYDQIVVSLDMFRPEVNASEQQTRLITEAAT